MARELHRSGSRGHDCPLHQRSAAGVRSDHSGSGARHHGNAGRRSIDRHATRLREDAPAGKVLLAPPRTDVRTGAERSGSPVAIRATAPGYPNVQFDPERGFGRSGLALEGGIVYVSFASNDDARGWMMAYDAHTLAQRFVFCITPTGNLGGIWMAGAAPAMDSDGNLYVTTGNGSFDAHRGGPNYGMSVLRVTRRLSVADYFAPFNEHIESRRDLDFSSTGVMLLPDTQGPHEAVTADKKGWIFLVDRDHLGGFNHGENSVIEQLDGNLGGGQITTIPRTSTARSSKRLPAKICGVTFSTTGFCRRIRSPRVATSFSIRDRRRRSLQTAMRTALSGRWP